MLPLCMLQLCAIHTWLPITIGSNWLMYPTSHDRECGKLVSVLNYEIFEKDSKIIVVKDRGYDSFELFKTILRIWGSI